MKGWFFHVCGMSLLLEQLILLPALGEVGKQLSNWVDLWKLVDLEVVNKIVGVLFAYQIDR